MRQTIAASAGDLRAEILDADGKTIAPFSLGNCVPVKIDSTRQRLAWNGSADFAALAGKPVRFRFRLTNGQLYAFWVSPATGGASNGYVAAADRSSPVQPTTSVANDGDFRRRENCRAVDRFDRK